jgi:hypothetical protein
MGLFAAGKSHVAGERDLTAVTGRTAAARSQGLPQPEAAKIIRFLPDLQNYYL